MKFNIFIFLIMSAHHCFGMSWGEMLEDYKTVSSNGLVQYQYEEYVLSKAPTNIDKRLTEIPIVENGEELVDLKGINHARIQMLPDPSIPFEAPWFNSGLPNASKMRASVFMKLQAMIVALDELAYCFGYEPGQIQIKIFEGLRDLSTQKMLFDKKLEEILASDPTLTLEMAEKETAKWVSPYKNYTPIHSTGAAIDLCLWDSKNDVVLDMGTFGVIWGKNDNAPVFSENITDDQKRNRLYCLLAAEKAGLTNHVYEFWHFSFGDRHAAYWNRELKEKKAIYGTIQ